MVLAAFLIGVVVLLQGVVGLIAPSQFHALVAALQLPPLIYFAAVVRLTFGVVLILVASRSKFPVFVRALGTLIAVGGLLTPLVGAQFAQVVLGWWLQDTAVIRGFALVALLLGAFICFASQPTARRKSAA